MSKIIITNIDRIGDPVILLEDNIYYMYATYEGGKPFHVYTSLDGKNFEDKGVCLGKTFASSDIWAPEVIKYKNEYYISLDSIISIKIVHIINSMLIFVKKGRDKNERTSNRRPYAYSYE